jgi:hypothetical protein
MKIVLPVLSFVAGLVAGVLLVFANPLVQVGELDELALSTVAKRYTALDTRGFDIGLTTFLSTSSGPRALEDPANRHVRIGMMVLPAGDGFPAALAVKVSVLSPQNSLWRARLGTLDTWNIWWPGEGSVMASGYTNYWAVLRDLVWSTVRGRSDRGLAEAYNLSALPPRGYWTGVLGTGGNFTGQPGDFRERLLPRPGDQPAWELDLRLDRGRR